MNAKTYRAVRKFMRTGGGPIGKGLSGPERAAVRRRLEPRAWSAVRGTLLAAIRPAVNAGSYFIG